MVWSFGEDVLAFATPYGHGDVLVLRPQGYASSEALAPPPPGMLRARPAHARPDPTPGHFNLQPKHSLSLGRTALSRVRSAKGHGLQDTS